MINGTAGQMWPPFMTEESTLPFYSPDACRYNCFSQFVCLEHSFADLHSHFLSVFLLRSMELVYQRPGVMKGIPLYRFVAPKTLFANGTDYAPNEGFCPCRQSGLLNVSSCRHSEYACPHMVWYMPLPCFCVHFTYCAWCNLLPQSHKM